MKIYGGEDTPLIQCINPILDKWIVLWGKSFEEDSYTFMAERFDHKPTLQEIKDAIFAWYNTKIKEEILSGFTWKNIPIWLSMENQFNYKAAYDLAVQTNGANLPQVFKFGSTENPEYYKFETVEELTDFYTKATAYINQCLTVGWTKKDSINWDDYQYT